MESKLDIARLARVDLREVWLDEAKDFTPWLASEDGLERLGKVLGLDLERIATEVAVGPYNADIVAKVAAEEDHKVVIENQLGKTDHDHLGKAITYAAGLGAKTLVWVSHQFTEEHREALDWLNHNAGEKIGFFGLEVHAFRIDDSRPAPQFTVISRPNATAQAAREKVAATDRPSDEDLIALATKRHVEGILKILLKLGPPDEYVTPKPSRAYGNSFRCWRTDPEGTPRMVLGINVSGNRKQTPDGQLDIWLPVQSIATVAATSVDEVRSVLELLPVYLREGVDWIVRVKNENDAERVVSVLSDFFGRYAGFYAEHVE